MKIRDSKTLQKVKFRNEMKWAMNSKQYIDLQTQLDAIFSETTRKCELNKFYDVIAFT